MRFSQTRQQVTTPQSNRELVVKNARVSRSVGSSGWVYRTCDCECYPEQSTTKHRRASPAMNGNIKSFLDSVRTNCLTRLYLDVSGYFVQSQRLLDLFHILPNGSSVSIHVHSFLTPVPYEVNRNVTCYDMTYNDR